MKQLIIKDSDRNIGRQQEELMMLIGTVRRKEEDEKRYLQQVQQLRDALMQERMRMEEEMSHVKQRIKDSDRNIGRQQEELVMLHGTVHRKEEEEKRYLQQVQQLRDLISDKDDAYKVLAEQNIALVQEIRAKDDKIALLQSDMNETRDLRTLVQEHDVIVERFRAQVLGLQTENSRLKFAGDQMKVEVNKIGDELRLQVMNLQQMASVLDAETQLSERYRFAMESQQNWRIAVRNWTGPALLLKLQKALGGTLQNSRKNSSCCEV
jgi:chromosome segregation ATPase